MAVDKSVPPPKPKRGTNRSKAPDKKRALTSAEKQEREAKKRLAAAKRRATWAEKKLKGLEAAKKVVEGTETTVVEQDVIDEAPPTVQEYLESSEIIFKPNPGPQEEFLSASEQEVLYGGAAGGGKSYALLADPLRYVHIHEFRGILFRRSTDELRELILNSKMLYPRAFPGAKWSEKASTWTFPSGATLWLTYLDHDDDVLRYQGHQFCWIGFDELTQWPSPFPWNYMRSRLRSTHPDLMDNLCMRATTNPGGPGTLWVKRMFIDPAEWNTAYPAQDLDTGKVLVFPEGHERAGQPLFYRRFIPARLTDNPYLAKTQYMANLLAMPESQRRQLLEGDWDVVESAAFPEFRRSIHVVEPFTIPDGWVRFRAADWGYSSPACVLWFAVDWDNNLYVYRELYTKGMTADVFADHVLELERGEAIRYGVLDASTWSNRGEVGPSIAETMTLRGCRWRPSDRGKNSCLHGKLEVHRRLALQPDPKDPEKKKPTLFIFSNCVNLIRTLPMLPTDPSKPEEVDTKAEDHAYDALRYGCMSRPVNPGLQYRSAYSPRVSANIYIPVEEAFGSID